MNSSDPATAATAYDFAAFSSDQLFGLADVEMSTSTASSSPSQQKASGSGSGDGASEVPRPKRIACVVCRKRKLRCDGMKPSCGTCSRLGHECAYDEVRRKSGPKRGYVKALEARLAQVETLLNDQSTPKAPPLPPSVGYGSTTLLDPPLFKSGDPTIHIANKDDGVTGMLNASDRYLFGTASSPSLQNQHSFGSDSPIMDIPMPMPSNILDDPPLSWELMAMGLGEPLPSQEVIDALHRTYFEKIHPCIPILHKGRYLASLDMPPNMRPPTHLRYAIWTMAASVSDEHSGLQTHFYKRARKYIEEAELKGHGESIIAVASSQTWSLIACYEFKLMYFPRAWLSTGRAVRLSQMMGMHRLDGVGLDVKQCLPAPKDWIEREERRRTFWISFCIDRYASIGTGWPMTIEEKDILTNLPSTEEAFEQGRPMKGMSLKEAMTPDGASNLSPYGGVCLMACLFGRNLIHLHRPDSDDKDNDLHGQFWTRHRNMDHILLNIALSLPQHFRLPTGINDPNIVFTNMNIHTSTICLHQAAIFKADKNKMPATVSAESKIRCITAAAEIANIMRMVCHLDLSGMNPFISFCLYVAARVFVQYLKSRPRDEQVRASLQFLLTAMGHLKKKNPLTESFLVQLDVDLTGSLDSPENVHKFPYSLKKGQEGQVELFPDCNPDALPFKDSCRNVMMPEVTEIVESDLATIHRNCPCMSADVRAILEQRAKLGAPSANLVEVFRGKLPSICPCMAPEIRSFIEACARKAGQQPEYNVCPQSHNAHSSDNGQSPASMDLSDNSQGLTPSSHQGGSTASYSPLNFSDLGGVPDMGGGTHYEMPKDMNWELLDFDSNIGGMNTENFGEYFVESTT